MSSIFPGSRASREPRAATTATTDIAARGIDVEGVSHVINFELPNAIPAAPARAVRPM
jgi:hypothetical protein